jgi:hypothetical protein
MGQYQLVGTARNVSEIAAAMNARRLQLGLTIAELNEIAGFAGGYTAKIFAPGYDKSLGKLSLPVLLESLGLRLAIISDDGAIPPITRRALNERTTGAAKNR